MATMIVRFQVEDFDRWRRMFDEMRTARAEHGIVSASVHRNAADPEMVVTILRTASLDAARAWGNSETLHEAMTAAGVNDVIEIEYLEDVE
jgi:heme-degrading monooxygenase HmoA